MHAIFLKSPISLADPLPRFADSFGGAQCVAVSQKGIAMGIEAIRSTNAARPDHTARQQNALNRLNERKDNALAKVDEKVARVSARFGEDAEAAARVADRADAARASIADRFQDERDAIGAKSESNPQAGNGSLDLIA